MYVIVAGGGKVGYYLTKRLIEENHEVLLVEKDKKKCNQIAEELGEVAFNGDGCEVRTLEEIGTERADVMVAVTGDDEDNLVICQMAKFRFNVSRVIARINNPQNEDVFEKLGVATTVSSTKIIYNLIDQEVDSEEVIPLASLKGGDVEVVEVKLKEGSPVVKKQIKELHIAGDAVIATILRGNEIIFPRGDTILRVNDTIVALTVTEKEKVLRERLVGKR